MDTKYEIEVLFIAPESVQISQTHEGKELEHHCTSTEDFTAWTNLLQEYCINEKDYSFLTENLHSRSLNAFQFLHIDLSINQVNDMIQKKKKSEYHSPERKGPGSTFIKQKQRTLHYVEFFEWEWQYNPGKYIGQLNEDDQPHGYGHWSSSSQQVFGEWINGELYIGTIQGNGLEANNKQSVLVNQTNDRIEAKHENILQCNVNLDLLQKIHEKAIQNRAQINSDKEIMLMGLGNAMLMMVYDQ